MQNVASKLKHMSGCRLSTVNKWRRKNTRNDVIDIVTSEDMGNEPLGSRMFLCMNYCVVYFRWNTHVYAINVYSSKHNITTTGLYMIVGVLSKLFQINST